MKSNGKEKEPERNRVRINRRRGFMWKIYAASETCFLIAEADRVLCHLVMFLSVFLHCIYKMRYSCYQHSFVILGWPVVWLWLRNASLDKKKSEIILFKNNYKILLISFLHPCWTLRKVLITRWVSELHLDR